MYKSLSILTFFLLIFFIECKDINSSPDQIAINIANNLDNNSIKLLKQYCYVRRGELDFWQKMSSNDVLYFCTYKINKDTTELIVYSPFNFIKDFTSPFNFDTSNYFKFKFSEKQQTIVRTTLTDDHGQDRLFDTSVLTKQLFPNQNPFILFASLTSLKIKFGFIGTSYRSDIGDFIEFWITPQYKLTYMPDTTTLDPSSKRYWLDEFYQGKKIKEHWSLIKVYD